MKYKVDASGKILGRFATEIAIFLRGKNRPDFLPYKDGGDAVEVSNVEKLKISGNKASDKVYWRHTGYPGGIKKTTYSGLIEKDSGAALKKAVYGMLPKNRLRNKMMKRLVIK